MDHSARPTEDERVANAKPLVRAWKPLLFAALALVPVAIGLTFLDVETQNPIVHGIGVVVAFAILVLLALSILTAWAGAAKLSSETRKTERSPNSR